MMKLSHMIVAAAILAIPAVNAPVIADWINPSVLNSSHAPSAPPRGKHRQRIGIPDDVIAHAVREEGARGLPRNVLVVTASLEGARGCQTNRLSGAKGPWQFLRSTAARHGLRDRCHVASAARAAASLADENRRAMRHALGREPTGGELYLAHQQGATGAVRLLTNPQVVARHAVGTRAVVWNGGTHNISAREFAQMWVRKFEERQRRLDIAFYQPRPSWALFRGGGA